MRFVTGLFINNSLVLIKTVLSFDKLKQLIMKALWGSMLVDGSGKLGGHVYSKNRGGNYVRTKTTPTNPQTAFQSDVRTSFTSISQSWRALTAAQQAAWNTAVANFKTTDIFGSLRTPSGSNLYMRLNRNLHTVGVAIISVPPAPATTASPLSITAAAAAGAATFTVAFTPTPVPAGYAMVIRATAQQSPGKSFLKNQYRVVQVVAAAGASPTNFEAAYVARFGNTVAGNKIGVSISFYNITTGLKSQNLSQEIIVAA